MEEKQYADDEINLLDYLIVLAKRKKLIIGITFGMAAITAIIAFLLPPVYRAGTKILPPQQSGSGMASQLLSQLGGAAGLVGGAMGVKTPNELYIGLLKSRPVIDSVIDRFNLMKIYKARYREDARKKLIKRLNVQDEKKSGIITLEIEDRDPERAADMANTFVEELRDLNKRLAVTEASQRRLFFEEQLKDAKEALIKSEEGMQGFQEKTGALKIDEQAKAAIEGIAYMRAQIVAKEIELKVMRSFATPQNPDFQRVEDELGGLKSELAKLEAKGGGGYDPLMPTGRIPQVGTDYIRMLRELKYHETLYELMVKQYEMAKLDEARDAALIQVIEKAIPPEKKVKPKRIIMVIIGTGIGFFISVFAAFFQEFRERASDDPETKMRLEALKKHANFRF